MEFNEVLLHYPNSHFPTTGGGGGPDPDFRYTHRRYNTRTLAREIGLTRHPRVCGLVLFGR